MVIRSVQYYFYLFIQTFICTGYLKCVVGSVYRVAVVRAAVSALRSLNESQREQATTGGPLAPLLALAHNTLRDSPFFCDDQVLLADQPQESWTVNDVTCQVIFFCFCFLFEVLIFFLFFFLLYF